MMQTNSVDRHILGLSNPDPIRAQQARKQLELIGKPAVPALSNILLTGSRQARWEAAKALNSIHCVDAIEPLVKALDDVDGSVRWLAAEGLVRYRLEALRPVLVALASHPDRPQLRQGAHHVLHDVYKPPQICGQIVNVLDTLNPPVKQENVRMAALQAIDALDRL